MGGAKAKKKVTKPSDKFKFKFDWDKDQDTSADLNPLYDRPHESALAFGRGARAGVDRRVVAEEGARRQMALVAQSRRDAGAGRVTDEEASLMRRGSRVASEREARAFADAKRRHWSEKSAAEMTERDWRIFREDHNITTRGGRLPTPMRSWSEAGMPPEILRAIRKVGYDTPSPIQMASIPIGLLKRDVIGIAETGSGKTCAFVVPMLAYIAELPRMTDEVATRGPYALVMAPTRELAQQIEEETVKFAHFLDYRVASVVGGQDIEQQGFKLRQGCEIVIGTPGRVIDVLERRYTVLQQCNYIVLDEADRMIDMGFEPQVNAVMENMSADSLKPLEEAESLDAAAAEGDGALGTKYRMTYMFSATMPASVERLARKYLRNPAVVNIGSAGKSSDLIKQVVKWMPKQQKARELEQTLSRFPDTQAIVFVNAKRSVDAVCASVAGLGYSVASLHGGKSQDQREEALRGFKDGNFDVLVATDVAGRGIDVKNIDLVVNYELPFSIENYTHRIGRTGRAGRAGTAVAFLTAEDTDIMYDLKALLKSSNNAVPPELERHEASRVKPMRDGKGGWGAKMTREQMQGMQEIIH
jgi:ATP-dependent RNA helicase DDX23/PRP28